MITANSLSILNWQEFWRFGVSLMCLLHDSEKRGQWNEVVAKSRKTDREVHFISLVPSRLGAFQKRRKYWGS